MADRKIIILTEQEFNNYDMTEEEVAEYAGHLGLNPELDQDLFWIARQGLQAGLPAPWVACQAEGETDIFFYNPELGTSVWDHPLDAFHRELVQKHLEERVLVPVTLSAQKASSGWAVTGTNMAGRQVAELEVVDPMCECFGSIREKLQKQIELASGTALRLLTCDAQMLGHSFDAKPLCEVL